MKIVFNLGKNVLVISVLFTSIFLPQISSAASVESYFDRIRANPPLLRDFLFRFPKGGELHTHLDGAVYAESYIRWAAEDGKCISLDSYTIDMPPCDESAFRPKVADIQYNRAIVSDIVDAFSVRNYEYGTQSGHDQFFSTFGRYLAASTGRQGSMLAEVTARAERQSTHYLELMVSYGMAGARELTDTGKTISELLADPMLNELVAQTISFTDQAEREWRTELGCSPDADIQGCGVEVRYLAQVIRAFPIDQILMQTLLAFKLIDQDSRFVGLNFVAPEDAPLTLRDYEAQMRTIASVALHFPQVTSGISLHAGELALPLVAPKELLQHIHQAVYIAGATRIGHGVDVIYETNALALLKHMATEKIMVEINLTSNAVILEVAGNEHPFELYRHYGVPMALSTDDEGVARIDLTHEYQLAAQTYDLSYAYLKELSRNAIAYSFLPGDSLFTDIPAGKRIKACGRERIGRELSLKCNTFLAESEKARLQWRLEERFTAFEANYN